MSFGPFVLRSVGILQNGTSALFGGQADGTGILKVIEGGTSCIVTSGVGGACEGALLLKLICPNKYGGRGRLEALMISPACCRRRGCFSDLLHPLADHPETLTFSYACCDAAPPASFPLDRMSMKEPLSPHSSPLHHHLFSHPAS